MSDPQSDFRAALFQQVAQSEGAPFINKCYRVILRRDPDLSGFQHFMHLLNTGRSKQELFDALYESSEAHLVRDRIERQFDNYVLGVLSDRAIDSDSPRTTAATPSVSLSNGSGLKEAWTKEKLLDDLDRAGQDMKFLGDIATSFHMDHWAPVGELITAAGSAQRVTNSEGVDRDSNVSSFPTRSSEAILNEIDPGYGDRNLPLTRFQIQQWHRFNLRGRFHLNTRASRFDYLTWYLLDHRRHRQFMPSLPDWQVDALNEPVMVGGNRVTQFMHNAWQTRFRHICDLYTPAGYRRFLVWWATDLVPNCGLDSRFTPPDIERFLASRATYAPEEPVVTNLLQMLWEAEPIYQRYDVTSKAGRVAFSIDFLLHFATRPGMQAFTGDSLTGYWRAPILRDRPEINRFLFIVFAAFCTRAGTPLEEIVPGGGPVLPPPDVFQDLNQLIRSLYPDLAFVLPPVAAPKPVSAAKSETRREIGTATRPTDKTQGLQILGPISASATGLGTGMKRSIEVAAHLGIDFTTIDVMHDNPASTKAPEEYLRAASREYPVNLIHINAEFYPEVVSKQLKNTAGKYNIAYFFWETELCPWACELGRDMADEIWVPTAFNGLPFKDAKVPVVNVGSSVKLPRFKQVLTRHDMNLGQGTYTFMFSFDSHSVIHRKNPGAVARAFIRAFPKGDEDVALIIKTQNADVSSWGTIYGRWDELMELCSLDPRIRVVNKTMTVDEFYSLKQIIDCYVSLHRSEGYGYGPAEAMGLGKAAIVTNYSGNLEFCHPENSFLVDTRIVAMLPDEYLYWTPGMSWGDPSVEHAASYMRMLYNNPEAGKAVGAVAKKYIAEQCNVETQAVRYKQRLDEIYLGLR